MKFKSRPRLPSVYLLTKADLAYIAAAGVLFGMSLMLLLMPAPK